MHDKVQYAVDDEFSQSMAKALIKKERSRARNAQTTIGPSSLGICRERLRSIIFEDWEEPEPPAEQQEWKAAAAIGGLVGEYAQDAYAAEHDGQTEVRVTAKLPCGISISGNADLVLPKANRLVDIKTKARTADASTWGPSYVYLVQISVYTVGLVQMGLLKEGATATLCYIGRSGQDSMPWSVTLTWEQVVEIFQEADRRVQQVIDAHQRILLARKHGDAELENQIRDELRDCSPAYALACDCPCAKGASWDVTDEITEPSVIEAADRYIKSKQYAEDWKGMQDRLKEELRGWSGVLPDGTKIFWNARGALTVRKPKVQKDPTV